MLRHTVSRLSNSSYLTHFFNPEHVSVGRIHHPLLYDFFSAPHRNNQPDLAVMLSPEDNSGVVEIYGRPPLNLVHPGLKRNVGLQSYMDTTTQLFSDWDFGHAIPVNEKPVMHASPRGETVLNSESFPYFPGNKTIFLPTEGYVTVDDPAVLMGRATEVFVPPLRFRNLTDFFVTAHMNDFVGGGYSYTLNDVHHDVACFDHEVREYDVSIKFLFYYRYKDGDIHHMVQWDVFVSAYHPYVISRGNVFAASEFALVAHANAFTLYYGSPGSWDNSYLGSSGVAASSESWPFSHIAGKHPYSGYFYILNSITSVLDDAADSVFIDRIQGSRSELNSVDGFNLSFSGFSESTNELVGEAAALSCLAAADAYDKGLGGLDSNWLEALAEAKDLGGITSTHKLIAALPQIGKMRGSSLIFKVLRVLSSANLIYSFGLRPTGQDVTKLISHAERLRTCLDQLTKAQTTLRGTYISDPLDDFMPEFPECRVLTGVKIVVNPHPDSLMTQLIPLKAFGLFPDLSTIWDIIPFSFLLDYVVSIGGTADIVDSTMQLLALNPIYSVVTLRFIWRVPSAALGSYSIVDLGSARGGEPLHYRNFVRYTMSGVPFPLPSRLLTPALLGGNIPNWSIPASLFIQFV